MHFVGVNYAPDSSGEKAAEPEGAAGPVGSEWAGALPSVNCGPEFGVLWNGD